MLDLPLTTNRPDVVQGDQTSVSFDNIFVDQHAAACKKWVMRCWCGYLSGARCKWFAYGSADATAIPSSLASLNPKWFCLSGAVLPGSAGILLLLQSFYGPLSGTTQVSQYQKNIHPPTILIIIQPLSASSIYYHPQCLPCSIYVLDNLFALPLSKSSLVYLLVWSPPPHIPYISSFSQCLLFATHTHAIATCFAVIRRLYHLFLVCPGCAGIYAVKWVSVCQHAAISRMISASRGTTSKSKGSQHNPGLRWNWLLINASVCLLSSGRLSFHEIYSVITSACWILRVRWPWTMKSRGTAPTTCRPSRSLWAVVTGRRWGTSTVLLLSTARYVQLSLNWRLFCIIVVLYMRFTSDHCLKVKLGIKGKGFPILYTERWAWSWSRCTGSQPAGDRKSSTRR